ncbi:uncharacterized protein LOC125297186 isoform X2 [Alosa alosa]|uniref:uncharacterized protein LOC125297186 isoform X2 n=1 Tax=Alosa alosa TaxID=278164 RepID=UPI0020154385|nr:uncharacterized protein LOC125297186 isoform X2 [Alosa alosa]
MNRPTPTEPNCKHKEAGSVTASRNALGRSMEGAPENLDDEAEADEERPSSILWERCIQQSIFVDISEDDSLHFSDLQPGSFNICLNQDSEVSESSIKISENTELDSSDEEDKEFAETSVTTSSGGSGTGSSSIKDSATHLSRTAGKTPMSSKRKQMWGYDDDPVNTSDEDQEDLPYDGDLIKQGYLNDAQRKTSDKEEQIMNNCENISEKTATDLNIMDSQLPNSGVDGPLVNSAGGKEWCTDQREPEEAVPTSNKPQHVRGTLISDLLLRHFTQEHLLNATMFIDAETLPDVSLMESLDDTVVSMVSQLVPRQEEAVSGLSNGNRDDGQEEDEVISGDGILETLEQGDVSGQLGPGSERSSGSESKRNSPELRHRSSSPQPANAEDSIQRCPLVRTRSFSELKYGQGQVHYPLPDFSKVAPKVKIPKASSAVRSVCPSPGILRAQSSPGMLAKSSASNMATMNVISRVLEDAIPPPEKLFFFREQEMCQGSVHHLQAEYDMLVTKNAEAENLIDQMRLGANIQARCEPSLQTSCSDKEEDIKGVGIDLCKFEDTERSTEPHQKGSDKDFAKVPEPSTAPPPKTKEQSEGEKMTSELMAIISQFGVKVAEFKNGVSTMSISIEEQQMVFKSITDAQDQLERNYMAKKEEHRALEMRSYMGIARNTGEFDPDKQVEGEIFRIGMLLEDVKEQIDTNVCQSFSPPPSTSTPAPPSPQPPLHEEMEPCFSTSVDECVQENGAGGDGQASAGSALNITGDSSISLQYSDTSLERLVYTLPTDEEEESLPAPTEDEDHGTLLASSVCSVTEDRLWDSVGPGLKQSLKSVCELSKRPLGGALSVSNGNTQDPLDQALSSVQKTVSPEIDSGFGSTDLSRPTSEQSQPQAHTQRLQLLLDHCSPLSMSGSDSEVSASLLQTTINTATIHRPKPLRITGTDQWLTRCQQDRPISCQDGGLNPLKEGATLASEQLTQLTREGRVSSFSRVPASVGTGTLPPSETQPHVCSCHNEAILTLQSEVANLKRELEERLSHLPHFSKQVAQLAQARPRQERRPKAQPRGHHRPSSSRCTKSNSGSLKVDDWISSDMDQSKSKGTDSGGSDLSGNLQKSLNSSTSGFLGPQRKSQISASTRDRQWSPELPLFDSTRDTSQRQAYRTSYLPPAKGMEDVYGKDREMTCSVQPLQRPLRQVNYASSCSLPAGFKVLEGQSHSVPVQRRCSTQSDSALLPGCVFLRRTPASPLCSPRPQSSKGKHRNSKDEDISRTLDKAIEAARSMKHTTERMAKSLSADLAKAELQRKLRGLYPLENIPDTKP